MCIRDSPETDVLSTNTGHRRDYGEGVAYHDYFATDKLMFGVPKIDKRLKNKDEVLAFPGKDNDNALAISASFLQEHPLYLEQHGSTSMVVITDSSGANRVYETGDQTFANLIDNDTVETADGERWTVTESALILQTDKSQRLERLPAHRAFWFGWQAVFPDTRLVK